MNEVKTLEHPTLKVPYELLNKEFRIAQKNIDRELSYIAAGGTELDRNLATAALTQGQGEDKTDEQMRDDKVMVEKSLNGLIDKLMALKRKAVDSIEEEIDASVILRRRIDHLTPYDPVKMSVDDLSRWRSDRLNRMLVDHLLRNGYYDTATQLARKNQIEELTNIHLFMITKDVEQALIKHDISKCLAWCSDNKSKLRKMKSSLEFNLRQQEFIELIRSGNRLKAVQHAQKYFFPLHDDKLSELQNVMGMLAFPVDTDQQPYKDLFQISRWDQLLKEFRSDSFHLYQLSSLSTFTVSLQAGLSALKTPQCYHEDETMLSGVGNVNKDCPLCDERMSRLAEKLPYAHCSRSRLVCSISKQLMDDVNIPMMLPNGFVYGLHSLEKMYEEHGKLICPKTSEIFQISDAVKVFIM